MTVVLWLGWPPSPKSDMLHASPSVVLSSPPVAPFPAMTLAQEQAIEHTADDWQEQKRLASSVARLVDLNFSTRKELDVLPGIGPVLADRIVRYRLTHGNFQQIAELVNVVGIGPKRLQRLQPFVSVEGEPKNLEG